MSEIAPPQEMPALVISSGGMALDAALALVSVTVRHGMNQIPEAEILVAEGLVAQENHSLMSGSPIAIAAGSEGDPQALFSGVVVSQHLRMGEGGDLWLAVSCRGPAMAMTRAEHTRMFESKTLDELAQVLVGECAGLSFSAGAGTAKRPRLQYRQSDWDFLVASAMASGQAVVAQRDELRLVPLESAGEPVQTLTYGVDLLAWDACSTTPPSGLRGSLQCLGNGWLWPGDALAVAGLGPRFSGRLWACAVTHRIVDGAWTTQVDFGLPELSPVVRASGISGLLVGEVRRLTGHPEDASLIQVAVSNVSGEPVLLWVRVAQFYATDGRGAFFLPEIGDEVVLGALDQDASTLVVLGSVYGPKRKPAECASNANDLKRLTTRSGLSLAFDDEEKSLTLTTPGGNQIVISDQEKSIHLKDQNSNEVCLDPEGIRLISPKDISLKAQGNVDISAAGKVNAQAKGDALVEGLNTTVSAQVGLVCKGSASAELSASGQTAVKGAVVMIN